MHPVREQLRRLLTREERLLDDWLHDLANVEEPDEPEKAAIEAMGFGLWFRAMAIAARNPHWKFFEVLKEAQRSCHAKEQIVDLIAKTSRRN